MTKDGRKMGERRVKDTKHGMLFIVVRTTVTYCLTGFDRRRQPCTDLYKPPIVHKAIKPLLKTVY